jgi:hypothetical protein
MMTLDEIQVYAPGITQRELDDMRARRRAGEGPPFRMTIEYPPPTLTPEEEAAALAQAQHDDEVGDFGAEEGTYVTLRAQTEDDAIAEAGMLWRDGDHDDALGYAVWRNDWGYAGGWRADRGNLAKE